MKSGKKQIIEPDMQYKTSLRGLIYIGECQLAVN